jgi:membrane-bound lytic murein transglycosylase
MRSNLLSLLLAFNASILSDCQRQPDSNAVVAAVAADTLLKVPAPVTPPEPISERPHSNALIFAIPDTLPFLSLDPELVTALTWQEEYLLRSSTPRNPATGFYKKEMLQTVRKLRILPFHDMKALVDQFDFYRINTDLKSDRVRVTGYYTPVIEASHIQEHPFLHALRSKPSSGNTDSSSVEGGRVLAG